MPVTYARTTLAVRDLTSEFGWDRVLCSSYGRIREGRRVYSTYNLLLWKQISNSSDCRTCVTSKKGRRKEEEIRRKKERMEKKEEKKRRTSPQNCRTEKKRCGAKLRECGGFESTGVPRGAASNGTEKKRCGGCVYLDAWRCWDYCITRCRIVLGCTSHFIFFSFAEF